MLTRTKRVVGSLRNLAALKISEIRYKNCYAAPHSDINIHTHITEAANWLCRAQDWGEDRGVSYGTQFGQGFMKSYPETTGYIIPTFIRLSEFYDDTSYLRRAVEMGDWEIEIQLPSGAVMAGMVNDSPSPAIFNTGQVILGWCNLYKKTGERRFLEAAIKAGAWLLQMQEPDGTWIKGNSREARADTTLYNVRSAWGLCLLGELCGEQTYRQAAIKNAQFTIKHQHANGWFENCSLGFVDQRESPLLHTLAYTMRGLLEIGVLTDREEFISAAECTALSLAHLADDDGFLPGRIDAHYRPAVRYACLTGSAQTAIVWWKMHRRTQNEMFASSATKVNRYLMRRHDISSPDPAIRGGVPGSWPVHGDYGRFKVLNWATKFFVDTLLEEKGVPAEA